MQLLFHRHLRSLSESAAVITPSTFALAADKTLCRSHTMRHSVPASTPVKCYLASQQSPAVLHSQLLAEQVSRQRHRVSNSCNCRSSGSVSAYASAVTCRSCSSSPCNSGLHNMLHVLYPWPAQVASCTRVARPYSCTVSNSINASHCSSSSRRSLPAQRHLQHGICTYSKHLTSNSGCSSNSTTEARTRAAVRSESYAASSSSGLRPPPVAEISSTANGYIKHCVKLRDSARYRQQQRRLLLVGSTVLAELAEESASLQVLVLFVRSGAAIPPSILAQHVITVTDTVMKKLTGLEAADGVQVVAELALPDYVNLGRWRPSQQQQHSTGPQASVTVPAQLQRLLVLEGVQDPGNLGTLLRSAAAFGWDAVWLLPGCCDPFNDKALRASRGAALRWPLATGTMPELLAVVHLHNMLLLAAHPESTQHQQQLEQYNSHDAAEVSCKASSAADGLSHPQQLQGKLSRPAVCLVLGTEGAGISDEVLSVAVPLAIPMSGHMESLNVGVAGSILMFVLSDGIEKLFSRLQQLGQLSSGGRGNSRG